MPTLLLQCCTEHCRWMYTLLYSMCVEVIFREVRSLEFSFPHTQSSLFLLHLAESYCQFYLSSVISKKLQNLVRTLKLIKPKSLLLLNLLEELFHG